MGATCNLMEAIAQLRVYLPSILGFLPRLRQTLADMAHEYRVPDFAFTLMYSRSRKLERIGNRALERLTGQDMPDFLDALLGIPHYILSAA